MHASQIGLNPVYRTRELFTGQPGSHHSSVFKDVAAILIPFHAKGHLFTGFMLARIIQDVLASLWGTKTCYFSFKWKNSPSLPGQQPNLHVKTCLNLICIRTTIWTDLAEFFTVNNAFHVNSHIYTCITVETGINKYGREVLSFWTTLRHVKCIL